MSLGNIVRLWAAADYKPDLKFYDRVNKAAQDCLADFEHWQTDRHSVRLLDTQAHRGMQLLHNRVGFEAANPEDLGPATAKLIQSTRKAIQGLKKEKLTRRGLKLTVYADLQLTFEELLEFTRPFCVSQDEAFVNLISSDISDVALVVDYLRDERTVMLRMGPMKKKQGYDILQKTGDIAGLFPEPKVSNGLLQFYGLIPEEFLYFDIDIYTTDECPLDQWHIFLESASQYAVEVFEGLKSLILAKK